MYRKMLQIRRFEEFLYRAFQTERMPGTMHQTNGQEAIAVGAGMNLEKGDVMTSTHRGHGHAIVKGVPINALMAEMYGRKTGSSGGFGGSMHIFDLEHGFLGTTGVVGAGVPIAVGAGLALKLEGNQRVAISFFGDGAANQGAVHEAINLAAVWHLPVVFICENNGYAVSFPISKAFAIDRIAIRAEGYGIPGVTIDGNDVLVVNDAIDLAIDRARNGLGPSLIEAITYRQKGHSRFEPGEYRPKGELENWLPLDPIFTFANYLVDFIGVTKEHLDSINAEVVMEIKNAISFARQSKISEKNDVLTSVFSK